MSSDKVADTSLWPQYVSARMVVKIFGERLTGQRLRDKIVGMIVGGAVGDALGMPVETWTPERIYSTHSPNGITRYSPPFRHKYFWGRLDAEEDREGKTFMEEGTTTDDTALTLAVSRALIEQKEHLFSPKNFNTVLDAIAAQHVEAVRRSPVGYGKTTLEAIERLAQGVHWSESAKTDVPNRGYGNGGPMKISPMAALATMSLLKGQDSQHYLDFESARKISAMTHGSVISSEATILHQLCLMRLLTISDHEFQRATILESVIAALDYCEDFKTSFHGLSEGFSMRPAFNRLMRLSKLGQLSKCSVAKLREEFGGGDCQVINSIPFSYAFFLRDPFNFESIVNVVNAGGDTDSNGYFVGSMIGALHGYSFFKRSENWWALNGLRNHEEVLDVADQLCNALGLAD